MSSETNDVCLTCLLIDLYFDYALQLTLNEKYSGFLINFTTLLRLEINMQQNGFNKELKIDPVPRDRPMQKSMLLPDSLNHPTSPNSRTNPLQFSLYTPMKKSLVSPQQNTSTISSATSFIQNNFTFNQPPLNFQQNNSIGSIYESRISSQTEPSHQSYTLKSLLSPYKSDPKSQQCPQEHPRFSLKNDKTSLISNSDAKTNLAGNSNSQMLVQQILSQIKEKHLPNIIAKLKKEVYDDIHNVRMEFNSLREQIRTVVKKQDGVINQVKLNQASPSHVNSNINHISLSSKQKHDKQDELAELQTHYFLLEGKLTQMEAKMAENTKIVFQQLQKFSHKMENQHKIHQIRPSVIRSNLSPILLEYKQSFAIKKPHNIARGKDEEQIIFNHCIYFIDKFGYLMDNENRYLLDHNGVQIRLQEKHLKMLEGYRILQR